MNEIMHDARPMGKAARITFMVTSYLFMIFLGLYYTGYQSVIDVIAAYFHTPSAALGLVISLHFFGGISGTALSAELSERLGKKMVLLGSTALVIAGTVVTYFSQELLITCAAIFMIGMGFTAGEGMVMGAVADASGEKRTRTLSLLNATFNVGAFSAPVIVTYWFDLNRQWREVYLFYGMIPLVLIILFSISYFEPKPQGKLGKSLASHTLIKIKGFRYTLVMAFCYLGIETGLGFWAKDVLGAVGGTPEQGAMALSLYWLAMLPGRLASAAFYKRTQMLSYGMILGALALLSMLIFPSVQARLICYFILGLGSAPAWAIINTLALNVSGRYSGACMSLLLFVSSLGGVALPPAFSLLSSMAGINASLLMILALHLVIWAMQIIYNRNQILVGEILPSEH